MLAVENITKEFSGVVALNNVSLELYAGKVNAILGENGAGKSTLMKILSGVYRDYAGRILFKGKEVSFENVRVAQNCGISIIHQELNLIGSLSVQENIYLGREIVNSWGLLDQESMRRRTSMLLKRLKLDIDPGTPVSDLKVGEQQVVEVAKALLYESEVIIMDEPTSAISEKEIETLFEIIEDLKKQNKIIVYISHKLDELFRIADRYVVMRDGCFVESGDMKAVTHDHLIQRMIGREMNPAHRLARIKSEKEVVLKVENLCFRNIRSSKFQVPGSKDSTGRNILNNISFQLRRGEVLGLFGLMGAGRTELVECLFGLHSGRTSGHVWVDGKKLSLHSPSSAIGAGIALVPEDRKANGLVLGLDVRTNICLTSDEDLLLDNNRERALSNKYIRELKIKTSSDKQAVKNLSGGNQQKIVVAKWLARNPKVLLLDEPTRGVDVGAKSEIYKLIAELANNGVSVLMVSSELPEILAVCHRVLVMCEGSLTAEIPGDEATENNILTAAIPKN